MGWVGLRPLSALRASEAMDRVSKLHLVRWIVPEVGVATTHIQICVLASAGAERAEVRPVRLDIGEAIGF